MQIRHVREEDWRTVFAIESSNFSESEAATATVIEERTRVIPDTFLVAELDQRVVGYIEGPVVKEPKLVDSLFHGACQNPETGGFVAVTSLSIDQAYQKQGIGTALIAALKDLVILQERQGIVLTCHDYLIAYYEMNGFENYGLSESEHGGSVWYDMVWKNPQLSSSE